LNRGLQIRERTHRLSVRFDNDVTLPNTGISRSAQLIYVRDDQPLGDR
jgi:uncharacterized UPF0146 family protein